MKKIVLFFILNSFFIKNSAGWGFWAHPAINYLAVFTLPPEMVLFYKNNSMYIATHAVDPDKRRYLIKGEEPRHFIDLDDYDSCVYAMNWKEAVEVYTEDSLMAHGIVPWHITHMSYQLTTAFREKNTTQILKLSAEIGHYIADAHVPLHTTKNYNGQLTQQHGIHGLWESRLPELYATAYDFFVGRAYYIDDPLQESWKIIRESHHAVDSVLMFEKELTAIFPIDQKYAWEERNQSLVKVYSKTFTDRYHHLLYGQVERRMRAAIRAVGSFWYTCWVNAGQPDLFLLIKQDQAIPDEENESKQEKIPATRVQEQ
jgi:hypothetical protein